MGKIISISNRNLEEYPAVNLGVVCHVRTRDLSKDYAKRYELVFEFGNFESLVTWAFDSKEVRQNVIDQLICTDYAY